MTQRIRFGAGTLDAVGDVVAELGCTRVFLLAGERHATAVARVRSLLGPAAVGRFAGARMHTPIEVTTAVAPRVRLLRADAVLAIGGGSATGLAKALAARLPLRQIIVPTTYAGSEVTPVLGETVAGVKRTRRDPRFLPDAVIYDPDLSMTLPWGLTVTSAINAMAHPVEALYSPELVGGRDPAAAGRAADALVLLHDGLRALREDERSRSARAGLLRGAWYAGQALASAQMGLHHRLCHVLGGTFALPHSATHTVVLPQVVSYNAPAAAVTMGILRRALGVADAPRGIFDLAVRLGAPTSLAELGMREEDVAAAARLTLGSTNYPNPRPATTAEITRLLAAAWHGARP